MIEKSDQDLLRAYVSEQSHEAFDLLVKRFIHMVYASALRQLKNPTLAEDVTQIVFVELSRKAETLLQREQLGPWLHQVAVFQSCKIIRTEERRKKRELLYTDTFHSSSRMQDQPLWEDLSPVVDELLLQLPKVDREIIVGRYLEGLRVSEIAERSGLKLETAKKRLQRALQKLSGKFQERRIEVSAISIAAALSKHGLEAGAAPLGLDLHIFQSIQNSTGQYSASSFSSQFGKLCSSTPHWVTVSVLTVAAIWMVKSKENTSDFWGSYFANTKSSHAISLLIQPKQQNGLQPEKTQSTLNSTAESPLNPEGNHSKEKEPSTLWWTLIDSGNAESLVKNLLIANFPRPVITDLLNSSFFHQRHQDFAGDPLSLLSVDISTDDELPAIKGIWSKIVSDQIQQVYTNLIAGGVPEDVAAIIIASLEEETNPEQPEVNSSSGDLNLVQNPSLNGQNNPNNAPRSDDGNLVDEDIKPDVAHNTLSPNLSSGNADEMADDAPSDENMTMDSMEGQQPDMKSSLRKSDPEMMPSSSSGESGEPDTMSERSDRPEFIPHEDNPFSLGGSPEQDYQFYLWESIYQYVEYKQSDLKEELIDFNSDVVSTILEVEKDYDVRFLNTTISNFGNTFDNFDLHESQKYDELLFRIGEEALFAYQHQQEDFFFTSYFLAEESIYAFAEDSAYGTGAYLEVE